MELLINIWEIGCFMVAAFIVMRVVIAFGAYKGWCEPSPQIELIIEKWHSLQDSGDALFGKKMSRIFTPLAMLLIFAVIVVIWPIYAIFMIAR
jgi:hypothetical protein